jgi:hypothetical protein
MANARKAMTGGNNQASKNHLLGLKLIKGLPLKDS